MVVVRLGVNGPAASRLTPLLTERPGAGTNAFGSIKVWSTPAAVATSVTWSGLARSYPSGAWVSVMTHEVPSGAWIAIRPVESVVTLSVITPSTGSFGSPLMMVFGRVASVVGSVQTMWNFAPASG